MVNYKIPLFKIYYDQQDIAKIINVIKSGISWAEGESIREFEENIAKYIGRKHCVVFNSGTSALHAVLLAYGIKETDEVIAPSFTFIATANAPLFVGAKPVFADIEEQTLGLDPVDVERKITRRTKAIIPVHYGGCPCKIEELRKIAHKYRLILIEDAAEAFGARIKDRKVGTFSDAAMFSFCQNKIITTGEGGAIVIDSNVIYDKLKLIRSHGRYSKEGYFLTAQPVDYIELGYNFRMPSFVASLGNAQLKKVDKIIALRRKKAFYLNKKISGLDEVIIPSCIGKDHFHVYQLYTIRVNKRRDELMNYLISKGVMTKVYFSPVHRTSFYRKILRYKCRLPVTERIAKEVLTLPLFPELKDTEMDYIIRQILNFLKERR